MREWVLMTVVLAAPLPAVAQDWSVLGGGAIEFLSKGGGADGGDNQGIETYLEGEISGFYLGVWGQLNSVSSATEVDLYLGYRNALDGGFDYDINYTRYYYPNEGGDCCGEIVLTLGQTLGDPFYVYTEGYWDPVADLGSAYLRADFHANDSLTFDAGWGVYNVDGGSDASEWELGAAYALSDKTEIDFRYYGGSDYDAYFGLTLSFDTTLFGGGADARSPDVTVRGDPRNRTY